MAQDKAVDRVPSIEFIAAASLVVVLIVAIVLNMFLVLKSNRHIVDLALTDHRRSAQRWDEKRAQSKTIKKLQEEIASLRTMIRQQAREADGEGMAEELVEDQRRQDLSKLVTENDVGTGGRRTLRGLG